FCIFYLKLAETLSLVDVLIILFLMVEVLNSNTLATSEKFREIMIYLNKIRFNCNINELNYSNMISNKNRK
ncbi:hypothetical protein, partial [Thomasclavelia sp.]|uniref:hypothetical protein n=1 Tax=Thomasclavelia sp. TaxID=3025757 RepID=UPI0025EA19D2